MHRPVAGIWRVPSEGTGSALAATAFFFFLGGLAGCVLAANISGGGNESLTAYLEGFLLAANAGEVSVPGALTLLWSVMRWPLFTVVLSFTALGLIGIPVLFCARGFLLSFAIASFVRMLGGTGGLLALAVFGVSGVLSIPALFVLGVQGLSASRCLAGRAFGETRHVFPFGRDYFLRCGMCMAAFCVCLPLECFAVPVLVSGIAGLLP
ncbi:MAG: hypothetical protein RRY53_02470 [Pseudoflavonifractor sp.]